MVFANMAAGRLPFVLIVHMDTRAHKHRHICFGFPFCWQRNTIFDATAYLQANIHFYLTNECELKVSFFPHT